MRYALGPRARNAARVTFATGCWQVITLAERRPEPRRSDLVEPAVQDVVKINKLLRF